MCTQCPVSACFKIGFVTFRGPKLSQTKSSENDFLIALIWSIWRNTQTHKHKHKHKNKTQARKYKKEVAGKRHGGVGLPAVTHNALEPPSIGSRTEELWNPYECGSVELWTVEGEERCYPKVERGEELPSFGKQTPPQPPLTAFWCTHLVLFEKI